MTALIHRFRVPLIAAGVVIVGGIAWYLAAPLFISQQVDERFPLTARAEIPADVTREQAEGVMAEAAKKDATATEGMPATSPQPAVLFVGMFKDGDSFHKGEGKATIYRSPDGSHLLRLEDFKVTNGPDLHVLLAGHPDPKERKDLESGSYVDLDKLKGNIGNQNYTLPKELDPARYKSVVIYCLPFHVVFSTATLTKS